MLFNDIYVVNLLVTDVVQCCLPIVSENINFDIEPFRFDGILDEPFTFDNIQILIAFWLSNT